MSNALEKKDEPITGKVSGILTERELAINIGSHKGVQIGMKFKVLTDKPAEIRDPDSNEVLGYVQREKVKVQATEVHEKFSICKTYKKYIIGNQVFSGLAGLTSAFSPPREIVETLKAEDASFLPPLSEEESYVKKGDKIIQISDEE